MKGVKPGVIQVHAVEINGVLYPLKQAFATMTGIDPLDFNTHQARGVFKRMGFKVLRVK